ncbi:MAG: hypothetical protein HZB32_03950 [Nitrospirae bacterium]|nr:hypothetical protein [Nitrospirota bacterium]
MWIRTRSVYFLTDFARRRGREIAEAVGPNAVPFASGYRSYKHLTNR